MQNMGNSQGGKMVCNCGHHKVVPGAVMLIGLVFLLGTFNILTMWAVGVIWPVLLMVIGGMKMMSHKCKCC